MVPSIEEMNGTGGGGSIKVTTMNQAHHHAAFHAETEVSTAAVDAVYVRNAQKSYGVGKRRNAVLRGLDMTVKKGTIYGLLGASGCGKTTLLSCIVGRRGMDSGEVLVFGGEPGTPESGIPGPRVGYMPQELALYGEFTITETLQYFGRIYNLPVGFVKSQIEFLSRLLDLPPGNRVVKTLSGGQQRRVSFAVAIFHEPELLILDEPTVGVDPLLRQSIWNHLVNLSRDQGKTVIITTHYIEEARQANTIGLMRSGRLLAEESPQTLLSVHGLASLEDVFLKLCMKDVLVKGTANTPAINVITDGKVYPPAGVDNPAFNHASEYPANNIHATKRDATDKDADDQNNKQLEQLAIMSVGCQYWKKDSSNGISGIYSAQEDGVIGLNFVPSGDHGSLPANHVTRTEQLNAMNNHHHDTSATESSKDFYGSSSSSSSAGDTSSSCGSTSEVSSSSSSRPSKRRSRTFALSVPSPHRTAALVRKNLLLTVRNIGMFLFIFLLPAAQAILFCLAIGRDPTFLKMAVVNEELNATEGKTCNFSAVSGKCDFNMYSCRYLRHLDNTTIVQIPYASLEEAKEATLRGEMWGVIHFGPTFTDDLMVRQSQGDDSDNATIYGSRIGISLDWSNQQISLTIQRRLIDAFDDFSKDLLRSCDNNPDAGSLPLTFLDPIYGEKNPSFTEFMAPGLILTIVYFIAVALTSGLFIAERKSGLMDRSLVAGVTTTEILLAHLVNQFVTLIGQTTLVLLFMLVAFAVPCHGNLATATGITLLQGLAGMCYGLLISSLCDEENSAIQLALGSFYPNLLLSGVMWPMEGMPVYLRYISYFLPQTYAIEALRNVMARGWGMDKPQVYGGVLISCGWISAFIILSLIVVRIRKYTG